MKPLFGFKLIYDMHSSLPQQLTNFNFSKSKILFNIFKGLEDSCLRISDAVITICPDLFNYVNTIIEDKSKHFLIENSIFEKVKLKNESPNSGSEKVQPLSKEILKKDIVVYAGTLEKYQGIELLVKGFMHTIQKNPNAYLFIVGGSPEQVKVYLTLAQASGLNGSVVFTGRVAQPVAKYYTSIAKVLVSPRSEGTNTPLKVYEQLASGIPLVATNIYSHTQVLTPEVAFLVDPTPEAIGNGIAQALINKSEATKKINAAKKMYEEQYSRDIYTKKLKKLFEHIK
jgi:glycosyltransferase involved in cell wall biosynthesis